MGMVDIADAIDFCEKLEGELNNNPLLSYKHLPGPNGQKPGPQEQFHNWTGKIKGLLGGNRSGKTQEAAEYFLRKALSTPKGRGWFACPSNELSIEIQQRKIWQLIPKNEIDYGRYDTVNGFTHGKVVLKNGFTMLGKAYEQGVEKFQADDVDIIWLDEEPPYSIYQECLMRTLDRGGEVIFSLTPLSGYTKFVDEVFLKKRSSKGGQEIKIFLMNTQDNIHLSEEQLELIESQIDEEDKPARLHGLPINKEGLVYPMWKDQYPWVVTVEDWNKVKDRTTRYTSIDPHNRTPTAVGFYGIDREGRFWLYDEIFERLLVPDLKKAILEKEGGIRPEWRTIDSSAQEGDLMTGVSLRMQLFDDQVGGCSVDTILAQKDHKNNSSIALMRQLLTLPKDGGLPMFVVVENCRRARYEFLRYSWASFGSEKQENQKDPKQEVKKRDDHIMDCNHYIIRSHAGFMNDDRSASNAEKADGNIIDILQIRRNLDQPREQISPLLRYKVA